MGIELYFSNHLDVLFNCLQINIKASDRHFKDIFEADQIVVLNSHTRKWLQLNFAKRNQVMANIKFPFLEAVLWDLLKKLDDSSTQADFLNKDKLRVVLYEILMNELPDELSILNKFISQSISETMKISRVWMLAEKIASLLMEYEYQRPEMIETWFMDKYYLREEFREIEKAQKYLYLLLLHPEKGLLQQREKPFLTLFQYYRKIFSKTVSKSFNCKPIHLFAISQVSVFHQKLLTSLKKYFDFHIYAFNPCCELWEDISSIREDIKFKKVNRTSQLQLNLNEIETGNISENSNDNLLLKAWGKTGREYTKLMSQMVDYQFYPGFTNYVDDINQESMLQRVKRHILFRSNGANEKRIKIDNSIQIFNAPNKYREVQTVYQNILYQLQIKPELKLQDVVILVPNLDEYKTALLSVFNGANVPLKFDFAGNMAISDSLWANGLLDLLMIARGNLNRQEVFKFLRNPCVMAKFNYSEFHYRAWVKLVNELNIFHHYHTKDKKESGFSEDSFFTWKQGLQRMRMGNLFDNNLASSQVYPEYEPFIKEDNTEKTDTFMLIIETIHYYVEILRKRHEPDDWVNLLTLISNEFLAVPENHSEENYYIPVLSEKFNEITSFAKTSIQLNQKHHVNLTLIYEYLVSALAVSDSVRGGFLNGGVVISELQPMRPFPFKITYILGLNGEEFPGRDVSFPLDLRVFKRRIGDILNSDRNRYHFLENLLSTTDCLYLSWVNKNLTTDENKVASSVILQLKRYLISDVISEADFKIYSMPLHSYRLPELKANNSFSCDLYQTFSKSDSVAAMKYNGFSDQDILNSFSISNINLKPFHPPVKKLQSNKNNIKVRMKDLEEFLLFPASSYFGFKLKQDYYENDETLELDNLEPLIIDKLQESKFDKALLSKYFENCFTSKKITPFQNFLENEINNLYKKEIQKSKISKNAFSKFLISKYSNAIIKYEDTINAMGGLLAGAKIYYSSLRFGHYFNFEKGLEVYCKQHPEIKIQIDDNDFIIKLKFDFIWFDNNLLHLFIMRKSKNIEEDNYSKFISFIFLLDPSINSQLPSFEKIIIHTIDGGRFEINRAATNWQVYLCGLLKSFNASNNNYLLSSHVYKAIEDFNSNSDEDYFKIYKEKFESTFIGGFSKPLPNYLKLDCFSYPLEIREKLQPLFHFVDFIEKGTEK